MNYMTIINDPDRRHAVKSLTDDELMEQLEYAANAPLNISFSEFAARQRTVMVCMAELGARIARSYPWTR